MDRKEAMAAMTRGNPELGRAVQDKMHRTRLVRCLIGMRAQAGLSQAEVAKRMKCSQSRVSKIEHGFDEDLSIGDLQAYTSAVGYWFEISMTNANRNATGLIKYHIIQANELLKKIVQLADEDKKMQEGADHFSMEMLVNFCRMLDETTQKIPDSTFQKIAKKAQPKVSATFELNCDNCTERDLIEA